MKLVHLDAARGIASIIVVFHHYALGLAPHWREAAIDTRAGNLWGWVLNGTAAVCFFFVLSGFVLTHRYFQVDESSILLRGALKRFPRLYLSCAISILLGFVLLNFGLERIAAASDISGSGWMRTFGFAGLPHDPPFSLLSAIEQTFAVLLVPQNFYFNSNLWTMVFEFWGSLFVFMLAWILMGASRISILLPICLVVLLLYLVHEVSAFRPGGAGLELLLPSLIFGCLVAQMDARGFRLPSWSALPLICFGLFACAQFSGDWDRVGGALLLLGVLAFRTPPAFLTGKLGSLLGEISFPLYLVHTVVILSVGSSVAVGLHEFGVTDWRIDAVTLLAVFGASLLPCMAIIRIERAWIPFVSAQAARVRKRRGGYALKAGR